MSIDVDGNVKCPDCKNTFSSRAEYLEHRKTPCSVESVSRFKCPDCDFKGTNERDLNHHRLTEHNFVPEKIKSIREKLIANGMIEKPISPVHMKTVPVIPTNVPKSYHINADDMNKPTRCPVKGCTEILDGAEVLALHKYFVHHVETKNVKAIKRIKFIESLSPEKLTSLTCDVCGFIAVSTDALLSHKGAKHKNWKAPTHILTGTNHPIVAPIEKPKPILVPMPTYPTPTSTEPEILIGYCFGCNILYDFLSDDETLFCKKCGKLLTKPVNRISLRSKISVYKPKKEDKPKP